MKTLLSNLKLLFARELSGHVATLHGLDLVRDRLQELVHEEISRLQKQNLELRDRVAALEAEAENGLHK